MSINSLFEEELEVLTSIYMEDLVITQNSESFVEMKIEIHPSTGEDENARIVCLTLLFKLTQTYPQTVPTIIIQSPRGLSDAHILSIEENLKQLSSGRVGEAMLFELIEYAKDSLTDNNHPSCVCPICLDHFEVGDGYVRLKCYHYFHKSCISHYVKFSKDKLCPVCRNEFDMAVIDDADVKTIPSSSTASCVVPKELVTSAYLTWREQCDVMFERQKQNGGIIDEEYERNKYLISLNSSNSPTVPLETNVMEPTQQTSQQTQPNSQLEKRLKGLAINDKSSVAKSSGGDSRPDSRNANGERDGKSPNKRNLDERAPRNNYRNGYRNDNGKKDFKRDYKKEAWNQRNEQNKRNDKSGPSSRRRQKDHQAHSDKCPQKSQHPNKDLKPKTDKSTKDVKEKSDQHQYHRTPDERNKNETKTKIHEKQDKQQNGKPNEALQTKQTDIAKSKDVKYRNHTEQQQQRNHTEQQQQRNHTEQHQQGTRNKEHQREPPGLRRSTEPLVDQRKVEKKVVRPPPGFS